MIQLQNISKYYYTETSVTQALRKVNLEFCRGEFVAITGESGSGKSTLLNLISGVDTFDEGEMYFQGKPTFQYDDSDWEDFRREQIGFIFQDYQLIGHYTALDNVLSALLIMGDEEEDVEETALQYLEKVGLKEMAAQRASELSSGQKQRLSIARALAKNTMVIVADEPTGNLDSNTGTEIVRLLKELSEEKLVLMVTHNYEQAEPYVTRKIRLHDGEVVADVTVNENQRETAKGQDREERPEGKTKDAERAREGDEERPEGKAKDAERAGEGDEERPEGKAKDAERAGEGNEERLEGKAKDAEKAGEGDEERPEGKAKDAEKSREDNSPEAYREGKKRLCRKQRRNARWFAVLNRKTQFGRALSFRIFFMFLAIASFVLIGQLFLRRDDTNTRVYDSSIFTQKNDSRLAVRHVDGGEITDQDVEKLRDVRNVVQVDKYDYCNDVNYYVKKGDDYQFKYGTMGRYGQERNNLEEEGLTEEKREDGGALTSQEGTPEFLKQDKFMRSDTCITEEDLSAGTLPKERYDIVVGAADRSKLGKTMKIYFTSDSIFGSNEYYFHEFHVVGVLKEETAQIYFHGDFCRMLTASAEGDEVILEYYYDIRVGYLGSNRFILTIGDDLEYDAEDPVLRASINYVPDAMRYDMGDMQVEEALPGQTRFHFNYNAMRIGTPEELKEIDKNPEEKQLTCHVMDIFNNYSGSFLEVPEELFNKYYCRKPAQASVYIKNYTKTDSVIKKLEEMGYTAVSTYRLSSGEYDEAKVSERLMFIGISAGILFVLFAVGIMILRALLRVHIGDYRVLKNLGLQMSVIYRISLYEILRYILETTVAAVIVMVGLWAAGVSFISGFMIYYGVTAYLLFVLYNVTIGCLAVAGFNRLLERRIVS